MRLIREHRFIAVCILAALIAAAVVFSVFIKGTEKDGREQADSIEQAIYDRALQCYVIEGAYPESLSYLEEHYGLAVNKEDYTIVYTPFADNLPPEIRVIYKEKKGEDR